MMGGLYLETMAYRDDQKCHICGEPTRLTCPGCQDAVCEAHTLTGRLEDASPQQRAAAERLMRRLGSSDMCQDCMAEELQASAGPFVEVVRLSDPITTQIVVSALLDQGLDARAIGTDNAALLGAGQSIFEQRVEVPEAQAERAEALARELLSSEAELPGEEDFAPDIDEEEEPASEGTASLSPRRRGIAAGLAFIFPGGSHYYARRPWTGVILTLLFFLGMFSLVGGTSTSGVVATLGAPLMDMVGGQVAVGAVNRGEKASAAAQLGRGMMMAVLILAVAWVMR